jgi:hypothetical protein
MQERLAERDAQESIAATQPSEGCPTPVGSPTPASFAGVGLSPADKNTAAKKPSASTTTAGETLALKEEAKSIA